MDLIDRLKQEPNLKKVSNETGIPYDRMAKWVRGLGNPKKVDSDKLELFFSGQSSINVDKNPEGSLLQHKYLSLLEEIAEERKLKAKSIEDRLIEIEEMLLNKTSPEPGGTRDGKTIEVNEDIISLLYKIEDDQKKILTNFHKVRAYLELTGQPQVDKQTLADAAKQVDKIREQYASGELGKRNKVLAPSTVKDGEKKK